MNIEKDEKITTISKIVEYIQFDNIFSLYRLTTKINEIGSYKFGICLNEEIEKLKQNPDYFSSKVDNYKIFKKDAIELMRENSEDFKRRIKELSYSIPEMLNISKDLNDFSEYVILKYDEDKNELFFYNSRISLPKSIHFEYPQITSNKYNIEKILEKLKLRKDLEILENNSGELIHDRNGEKFIRCIWKPGKYNWNILYEEKLKHYNFKLYDFIKEKIWDLKTKDKENNY